MMKTFAIKRGLAIFLVLSALTGLSWAAPTVRKVDPPNWWVGMPPAMLLITGEGLSGAQVKAGGGARVLRTEGQAAGHYLFIWLDTSKVKPGTIHLDVRSSSGTTKVPFTIQPRNKNAGSFNGVGPDDVVYLIMPDRFADGDASNNRPPGSTGTYDRNQPMAYHGGDLRGIREHLQYLRDLGVNTLWLTPVTKNTDSDYHGYHAIDFYSIDDHMGTLKDYQDLVAEAHKLNMKVLIDFVANHTGPRHLWASDPPSATWLHGTPEHHLKPDYTFFALIDPHATASSQRGTLEGWFVDRLPDLNTDDPRVAEYLLDNALWWTEIAGLDGYRLDTFPYSSRKFWSTWHQGTHRVYSNATSIGEVADGSAAITAFFAGGRPQFDGIDSGVSTVFDFPLFYAMRDVILHGGPAQKIVDVLEHDWLYPHPENLVTFFGNHDQRRFMGEEGATKEKLEAAFALLLTLRGVPQIYAGDEIGMPGGNDPDNRRDFPGGFPGDPRDAFSVTGRTPDEQDIFTHVQSLLRLRQEHSALRHGRQWHVRWDETSYAFVRETAEEKLLIVFNNSPVSRKITLEREDPLPKNLEGLDRLYGRAEAHPMAHGIEIMMPATSVAIFRTR